MGQSQSYDLRNPEHHDGKSSREPVRGVRRVSKEHQTSTATNNNYSAETADHFEFREEDELRERIRREQLMKREAELESMRIREHESREPIIDAYRQNPAANVFNEFNHYDSLKHPVPVDPSTQFVLKRRSEVNGGVRHPIPTAVTPPRGHVTPDHPEHSPLPRYVPPMSEQPPPGTYSKRTMIETTTYYSRGVPKRDPMPSDFEPTAKSAPSTYSRASRVPTYDEVPIRVKTEVSRTPESHVTHQRDIPVDVIAMRHVPRYDEVPVSPNIHETLALQRDVPHVTLDRHVTPRTHPVYKPKGKESVVLIHKVVHRDEEPIRRYDEVPDYEAPVLETLPLQTEVSRYPLDRHVTPRTHPVYTAAPSARRSSVTQSHVTRTPTPTAAVVYEALPLQTEVSRYPLDSHVTPRTHPVYAPGPSAVTRTPTVLHEQLPLQTEVSRTPLNHHVTPRTHPVYAPVTLRPVTRTPPPPTTTVIHETLPLQTEVSRTPLLVSELHAEKRMVVGIEPEPESEPENVTYVTVTQNGFPTYATSPSSLASSSPRDIIKTEPLHRHPEIGRHPILAAPPQTAYEGVVPSSSRSRSRHQDSNQNPNLRNQQTQYSRRPSEDVVTSPPSHILERQNEKRCHVENCTHIIVPDVSQHRRDESQNRSRLTIFVDETREMENVVALARDEDVGPMTSTSRRCFEEKLFYNAYMPTLSLGRRPIVSFYDKLH